MTSQKRKRKMGLRLLKRNVTEDIGYVVKKRGHTEDFYRIDCVLVFRSAVLLTEVDASLRRCESGHVIRRTEFSGLLQDEGVLNESFDETNLRMCLWIFRLFVSDWH